VRHTGAEVGNTRPVPAAADARASLDELASLAESKIRTNTAHSKRKSLQCVQRHRPSAMRELTFMRVIGAANGSTECCASAASICQE